MSVTDIEITTFKRVVSCAALLENLPPTWTLDKRESSRDALKYRRGEGEIIIVNHNQRGWWDPQSAAKGDVCSLVQYLDRSLTFGQVRKILRRFVGVSASSPEYVRTHRPGPSQPPAIRWTARSPLRVGSPGWNYLAGYRCIPGFVLARAVGLDAIREGFRGSVWFAHRGDDVVRHVEVRGPTFKGSLRGGSKSLFRLSASGVQVITRLALTEAPIDALSRAAIEGLRPGTLYAATGGGMGIGTIEAIEQVLIDMAGQGGGELASATDANVAGERYATRHAELARSAGINFVRLTPTAGTDWNDVLKGQGT